MLLLSVKSFLHSSETDISIMIIHKVYDDMHKHHGRSESTEYLIIPGYYSFISPVHFSAIKQSKFSGTLNWHNKCVWCKALCLYHVYNEIGNVGFNGDSLRTEDGWQCP